MAEATGFLAWDNHAYLTPVPGSACIEQLDRHRRAGFSVVFLNLGDANRSLEHVVRMAAFARHWLRANSDRFLLLDGIDDIDAARRTGRLAVGFNVEGAYAIGDRLETVQLLADLGIRWMLLVYNRRNLAGSGVHDATDDGLTGFGRRLTVEMDRAGIIKCLSHTGYRTAMDVLSCSEKPCIFSHSNARALADHPRNIPDPLIRACAETGGVVGINGINLFLGVKHPDAAVFVRHIDHVVQMVGPTHAGIGLDYAYVDGEDVTGLLADANYWPPGNGYEDDISCLPPESLAAIVSGLERLGYPEGDIAAILGGNMRRVAAAVWR